MAWIQSIRPSEPIEIVANATLEIVDPLTRVTHCLGWLSTRLDGIGSTLTQVEQPTGPGSIALVKMVDIGYWGPVERASRDAYYGSDNHAADPFAAEFCTRDFSLGPTAAIREDCVSDREWYDSPHVRDFRKRAEMDSAIYVSLPVPAARVFGLCINRRWGKPPFDHSERDFAQEFMVGIIPLLSKIWLPNPGVGVTALDELPIRLRKVMGVLLNGDSEKVAAEKLCLSPHTIHSYVKDIYEHFGVSSRGQLLAIFAESSFRNVN